MTVAEAAKAWGCSRRTVLNKCRDGDIPGAHKVKRTAGRGGMIWFVPDRAKQPCVRPYDTTPAEVKLPSPKGIDPVQYVWEHQDAAIHRLAGRLGVTMEHIRQLYDAGFERYVGNMGGVG